MPVEKIFETERDLDREKMVMQAVASRWQCEFEKMPQTYAIDFALKKRDKLWSFAEVRTKNHNSETSPMSFAISKN